jgi:DNA mismatch repair protein MutS
MIYDDYIAYTEEYQKKYGDKCVVFMQVGDFFEIYAVQNEEERVGADIYKICDLCNIQVSRKNKGNVENNRQNPLMAGFPLQAIHKFIQILIQYQYTIVLIRQVTLPPNPKREVTEVISPSTYMNTCSQDGNYLMTMVWEINKGLPNVGISCIDITTGQSYVYEAYSTVEDNKFALDEAIRFIQCYQPKELLLMGTEYYKDVANYFENMHHIAVHHQWGDAFEKMYMQPSYQNAILMKAFQPKSMIAPIEWIGLERMPLALMTYCAMIQFAYEHNDSIIKRIEIPKIWKNKNHLILEANSVQQLNILSESNNETPLIYYLNRCMTSFGSRLYKERLLNPILQVEKLNALYDEIEIYQEDNLYKKVHHQLSSVIDLERILRKISLATLQPCEWVMIDNSMDRCGIVLNLLKKKDIELINKIREYYHSHINIQVCEKYNLVDIDTSIFQKGIYTDVDVLDDTIQADMETLKNICQKITSVGENDNTLCRIDYNDRDGYFLSITKKRWDNVIKIAKKIEIDGKHIILNECKVRPISSSSSNLRLSHIWIEELSDRIISNQRKLSNINIKYYKEFLIDLDKNYHEEWMSVLKIIAHIDVIATNAKNSLEYNYNRPKLINSNQSYLKAKGMRHPIIERLNITTEYITNDIEIGLDKKGILLYGINASGKSSLMKAIGLNVLMAQAGMFVASSELELVPYSHLFTRITSMDNIYRGYSTFTMEILELKNILNRCDKNSLILGDELCSGTESLSAISIVAAGIHTILQRNANFVFATHLHELVDVSLLKEHPSIHILHMHIEIDELTGKIIYDRKLKPGNGSKVYGLEVCRALNLPFSFINIANQVRNEIQGCSKYIVSPKVSKYNPDVIVSECQLCGKPAKETHHIRQQKDADEYGYIDTIHKDSKGNLIVLCEECHLKQHHGDTHVEGYIQTTEGIELKTKLKVSIRNNPRELLQYRINGWMYKLPKKKKWQSLSHKNYEEFYMNFKEWIEWLPSTEQLFYKIAAEYQAEYFIL